MAGKISEYTNAVATFADGDLVDVSKRISTSPDIFQSQKLEFAQFQAFIQANASNILNTNGLTLGGNYSHNLNSNYLTFTNGTLNISQGSLLVQAETNIGSTTVLFSKLNGDPMWTFLDNGNVNLGVDSVVDLDNSGQENSLEFKTKDGVYSSFGFAKISGQGDVSIMANGSLASALTVYSSDNPTNTVIAPLKIARFYSGTSHLCSRFINIGYNLTTNYLNIQDSTLKFKGSGVDVHTIEHVNVNSDVSFFVNGIGNGGFIVGNNTKIGTEKISLQSSTSIKGIGTSGSSALAIYDNDTTPNKVFEVLDNSTIKTNGNTGFTGTGAYTNFTIENGIITNAS